jgi:hypothetical protein
VYARPAVQAGLVAILVGMIAQVWSHRTGVVFAFWDAQAHLDIARRVFDSTTPGLQMLGTVWLPVPHLLLVPFTMVDRWWWDGTAGGIVGLLSFVVIVASLHDLLVRRSGSPGFAWLGTAFVVLNPSLLYLQTTAMTEPVLLAALVASVNALDRWSNSGSRLALFAAACAAALAVGSRYDGWFYAAVATPLVAWLASRRDRRWLRDAALFAAPSALMVAGWLLYNWHYFGDPLEFQRGVWSAQSQQAALAGRSQIPTGGHLLVSLWYYAGATALCAGAVLTGIAIPATYVYLRRIRDGGPVVLLLLVALPFNVLALWARQSVIQLPWTTPAGVLNLRYGIMMLPGLAAIAVLGAALVVRARPAWRRGMLLAGFLTVTAQSALFAVDWPDQAGALREGLAIRDGDRRQQHASDWLAAHYDAGRVLVDEAINVSPRSRIALRNRVYRWTWQLGPAALAAPEGAVDWVIVDMHHADGDVARAISGRTAFSNRFDRVFENDGLTIWRRR